MIAEQESENKEKAGKKEERIAIREDRGSCFARSLSHSLSHTRTLFVQSREEGMQEQRERDGI